MLFDLSTPYAAYSLQNLQEAVKIFEPSVYLACYIIINDLLTNFLVLAGTGFRHHCQLSDCQESCCLTRPVRNKLSSVCQLICHAIKPVIVGGAPCECDCVPSPPGFADLQHGNRK